MTTFKPFQYFGTCIRATHNFRDLFPAFIELLKELEKGLPSTYPRKANGLRISLGDCSIAQAPLNG